MAIPLLPLWAFVACYGSTFTFTFTKPYSIFLQRNGTYFLNKPRINQQMHSIIYNKI